MYYVYVQFLEAGTLTFFFTHSHINASVNHLHSLSGCMEQLLARHTELKHWCTLSREPVTASILTTSSTTAIINDIKNPVSHNLRHDTVM